VDASGYRLAFLTDPSFMSCCRPRALVHWAEYKWECSMEAVIVVGATASKEAPRPTMHRVS
jgi:hypothetical protein